VAAGAATLAEVSFDGIPLRAFEFYAGLEADNSKTYWTTHKAIYDRDVKAPLQAFAERVERDEHGFGEVKLFRPHRDVRFSADKSPYKDHQGLVAGQPPGLGYYLQISAEGLALGGGFHAVSPAQTAGWRAAVDAPASGGEIAALVAAASGAGADILGERVKTTPRGYAADHPRIELIRLKELMLLWHLGVPDWIDTPAAGDRIIEHWRTLTPIMRWLETHIPAAPPRDSGRR
jgi:uncharacterized protein (TIGR02453 family)